MKLNYFVKIFGRFQRIKTQSNRIVELMTKRQMRLYFHISIGMQLYYQCMEYCQKYIMAVNCHLKTTIIENEV